MSKTVLANVTGVALSGRVVLIEGPPGAGKTSLALALIDRGAVLVGDDAVAVERESDRLVAGPPPNTAGLIEIRNLGLVEMPTARGPVALMLTLDRAAPRHPLEDRTRTIEGVAVPALSFFPGDSIQALRAEWALERTGLRFPPAPETAMIAGDD